METKLLGPQDIGLLLAVEEGVFDFPIDPEQARDFLENPVNEIVVVIVDDRIVAFASGTILLHPDKPPSLFVNEVSTHDEYRRRGYGLAVSRGLFARARARGCEGIWLGTEPENTPALALYRRLGGEERAFVGFAWDGAFDLD